MTEVDATETALIPGIEVIPVTSLPMLYDHLTGGQDIQPLEIEQVIDITPHIHTAFNLISLSFNLGYPFPIPNTGYNKLKSSLLLFVVVNVGGERWEDLRPEGGLPEGSRSVRKCSPRLTKSQPISPNKLLNYCRLCNR